MKHSTKALAVWILGIQLISSLIGRLSPGGTSAWYQEITRSAYTPPGYVFPIVWPVLYLCIAVVGWRLWMHRGSMCEKTLFVAQLLMNWLWSPVFFIAHQPTFSFGLILGIVVCTLGLMYGAWARDKWIVGLLTPYLLWSVFAGYLNGFIMLNN